MVYISTISPWITEPLEWLEALGPHKSFATPYLEEFIPLAREYIQIEKLRNLPNHLLPMLEEKLDPLTKILQALDAGYEPCTPPEDWYCGIVLPQNINIHPTWLLFENFPRKKFKNQSNRDVLRFKGMMPANIIEKWQKAAHVFLYPGMRVYSPNEEDFEKATITYKDPILIGRVYKSYEERLYFRIAQWDLAKDLSFMPKTST